MKKPKDGYRRVVRALRTAEEREAPMSRCFDKVNEFDTLVPLGKSKRKPTAPTTDKEE